MATFDSDFSAGEDAARVLKRRMEEKLKSAEAAVAQAKEDKRFTRRLREQARREVDAERKAPRGSTTEADAASVERRLAKQRQLSRLAGEELRTSQRLTGEMKSQERSSQRLLQQRNAGRAVARRDALSLAEQQLLLGPGGGGGGRGGQPPRYFQQPPPPGEPPRRPQALLPSGRTPYQIAQVSEPHPERAGQVIAERELRSAEGATRARERANDAGVRGKGVTDRLTGSIGRETSIQASANREFQRFGALSTEWIGAAGRGSTTIQELGRQTTATIGKFGGWLAAGSLVFTALDGVRSIGKGAIASLSGVNQLQRVLNTPIDSDQLQKAFRADASFFNLPIEQVSDATYEMGKVFKTQEQALEGAKAVLYAVKVGELDTATASRYLIASINGFGIPASKMQVAFDEINQAQNEFGVSISDGLAGVAKAAGAWDAASKKGGPMERYHNLLAFIATAQKVTGQTGNVVGTAVQRIPGQLAQTTNQATLKKYGLEYHGDIQSEVIIPAFEKFQEINGREKQELASAIFGKQYGPRIGVGTLAQYDKYKAVSGLTTEGKAKGSGERELLTQLGAVEEKIKRIGVELEDIGSGLAQAGFFNVLGLGLEALNLMLRDANELLELFNLFPSPMKEFLVYAIQARLVLGAMRKFNIGDNFAEGTLGRKVFSGPNRTARLYDEQLVNVQKQAREELSSVNPRVLRASRETETTRQAAAAARAERDTLGREGHISSTGVKSERYLAAEQNALVAEGSYQRALGKYGDLSNTRLAILTELKNKEAVAAALQRDMTDLNARQLAAKEQEVIQGTFNKGAGTVDDYGRQLGVKFEKDPATGQFIPVGLSSAEEQAAQKAAREAGAVGKSKGRIDALKTKLTGGFSRAQLALSSVDGAMVAARTGITKTGEGLKKVSSSLGGLGGIGTIGLLALPFLQGPVEELAERIAGGQKEIEASEHLFDPKNSKRSRRLQSPYKRFSDDQLRALDGFSVEGVPSWYTARRALDQRLEQRNQRQQAQQGEAQRNLFPDQLAGRLQQFAGLDPNQAGYGKARRKLEEEIASGNKAAEPKEYDQVKKHFEEITAKNVNKQGKFFTFLGEFDAISEKLLAAYQKNLATLVQGGPAYASQKDVRALVRVTEVRGLRNLTSGKSGLEAKGQQGLAELTSTLEAYGAEEFKLAQSLARTDRQREAAYGPYIKSLSSGLQLVRATKKKALGQVRQESERLQQRIRSLRQEGADETGIHIDAFGSDLDIGPSKKTQKQYDNLQKKARALKAKGKQISRALRQQEKQLRAVIQEQRDALTEEHLGVIGEKGELASARIGGNDPVGQARTSLTFAEKALNYARSRGASQKVVRGALLSVLQARESLEDAVKSEAEELSGAIEARAVARANGDPILEAKAELEKAQSDLAAAKKPAERIQAEADLIDAEHKLDEARADIALSRLTLAAARTEDPVKQATLKVREAEIKLRTAHGAAAKNEARAAKVEAKREARDAAATQAIENVEFDADIGRITVDQEIAQYTRLLHTLKLGKQARRSLIEKIHALQEEASGSLELTVGNIALPTLYDIRRAVQGGVNGGVVGPGSYNDNSSTHLNFNIHGDRGEIEQAIGNAVSRHTKQSKRSAGVRG